jgi:hypothetical protein
MSDNGLVCIMFTWIDGQSPSGVPSMISLRWSIILSSCDASGEEDQSASPSWENCDNVLTQLIPTTSKMIKSL